MTRLQHCSVLGLALTQEGDGARIRCSGSGGGQPDQSGLDAAQQPVPEAPDFQQVGGGAEGAVALSSGHDPAGEAFAHPREGGQLGGASPVDVHGQPQGGDRGRGHAPHAARRGGAPGDHDAITRYEPGGANGRTDPEAGAGHAGAEETPEGLPVETQEPGVGIAHLDPALAGRGWGWGAG